MVQTSTGQCFGYEFVNTPAGVIPRPMLTMTVQGPGGSVNLEALFDSGSDITLLPKSVGQSVGFNPSNSLSTYGVSGSASGEIFNGTISVGGETFSAPIFIATSDDAPILLGRATVWNQFDSFTFYNSQQQLCFGNAMPQAQSLLLSPQIITVGVVALGIAAIYMAIR